MFGLTNYMIHFLGKINFSYFGTQILLFLREGRPGSCDPRTWELAAPSMVSTSSRLLPRSTAIGWLNKENTMSSRHLWWGPSAPTFWDHCQEEEKFRIKVK